ncbi:MAG: hypothetical protein JNK47_10920 [Mesorhizobium sp.]|nr:hypothetical protein [Mesorhizobium sp.]MBL8577730.1 hypothetical protein [Mesorhizobium sp.]
MNPYDNAAQPRGLDPHGGDRFNKAFFALDPSDPVRVRSTALHDQVTRENAKVQGAHAEDDRAREEWSGAKTDEDNAAAAARNPHDPRHADAAKVLEDFSAVRRRKYSAVEATGESLGKVIARRISVVNVWNNIAREIQEHWVDGALVPFRPTAEPAKYSPYPLEEREQVASGAREIRLLKTEWRLPRVDRLTALVNEIDRKAGKFGVGADGSVSFPTLALSGVAGVSAGNKVRVPDVVGLMARYNRDQVIADITADLDAYYAGIPEEYVGPLEEQRKQIAKLVREVASAERREVASIWSALERGDDSVFFRPETLAHVILGVEPLKA